ncbi:MAG: phosphoribosylaminoimidazolesuccinocarboxamide synthase [Clostridia bacterium]|nr:phosphoribosylaminoimidazolesuccinocarboxamide synthase [Clostridia bacterium]
MEQKEQLYEGKAKKVYATTDPDLVIVDYKDDATAFNGLKKGTIVGKGVINNRMSNFLMEMLEKQGIETHFVEELSERRTLVKHVEIVPLEVIMRNVVAGSLSKRTGLPEGELPKKPVLELYYKSDELGDPMINSDHALAFGWATEKELAVIEDTARKVNDILKKFFAGVGVDLVDFKIEFGRYKGKIILADEISPDTCRFWDSKTKEKLDKDRFRRDMGGAEDAYKEMMRRIGLAK